MKLPILLALGALALTPAHAAVSLLLSDSSGDPSSTTVAPGESFDITLSLTSTQELTTAVSYLMSVNAAGSGGFRIVGLSVAGSGYSDLVNSTGISLSPTEALLDPTNTFDLGGLVTGDVNSPGTYLVATLTLQALPTIAPGSYTISTDSAFALNESFDSIQLSPATYTVNTVPEAQTVILLGVAALAGLKRRRK